MKYVVQRNWIGLFLFSNVGNALEYNYVNNCFFSTKVISRNPKKIGALGEKSYWGVEVHFENPSREQIQRPHEARDHASELVGQALHYKLWHSFREGNMICDDVFISVF
jgi:hypothetical protein